VLSDNQGFETPAAPSAPYLPGQLPDGAVPPEVALRRSRIGLWGGALGTPILLAISALLVSFAHAPPGIGIIALAWLFFQFILAGGPSRAMTRKNPARLDAGQMLLTRSSWTGTRTLNLARLAKVRRVKWSARSEYGPTTRHDFVILTDSAGVRLSLLLSPAMTYVGDALRYQQQHQLPVAQVSRFASMGLGLSPSELGFRAGRTVVVMVVAAVYVAAVAWLMVKGIPALAPGHH
jgi:hypothetical protein